MSAIKKEKKALVEKMFEAFDRQDLGALKSLLTNGYYRDKLDLPNIPSSDGRILLHEAALSGRLAVIKLLIRQGADIYARNSQYYSAAEVTKAKRGVDDPIFKFLRDKELSLLQECVLAEDTNRLNALFKRGADLDIRDSNKNSIAHFAAEHGKVASLKEIEAFFGTNVFRNEESKNSSGKTPLEILRIIGRFFTYEGGAYAIAKDKKGSSKRPGNQNALPVLIKMTKRGEKVIADDSDLELVLVEKKLFNKVNSGKNKIKLRSLKIDIAHNIAISKIMDATLERMKSPLSASDSVAEDFADNLLSTDDDEGRKEAKKLFTDIRNKSILPFHIIEQADHVINHFNRASRNLRPGHSSTNRSVGDMRDPPLFHVKGSNKVREAPHSRRLARSAKKFIQKTGEDYQPHTRITNEVKEAKSSSFHANPAKAWFPYTSPKDIISPFSESSSESYKGENEDDEESPKQLSSSRYKGSTFPSKKHHSPIITSVAELTEEDDGEKESNYSSP